MIKTIIVKLTDEERKALDAEFTGWCECESESDPLYHENNVMPFDNCVAKHHIIVAGA